MLGVATTVGADPTKRFDVKVTVPVTVDQGEPETSVALAVPDSRLDGVSGCQ